MAALPQEKVGAATQAEEGEEEEEEAVGRRSPTCRWRSNQRWPDLWPGKLPPQNSSQRPGHALANCAGRAKTISSLPSPKEKSLILYV